MFKKMIFSICVALCVAASASAKIVAYYPLNEGSGTVVADASGNDYDGTIKDTPTWVEGAPSFGSGLDFVGKKDGVECGTWNPSGETGQLSVACWLKVKVGGSQYQGILAKRNNNTAGQLGHTFAIEFSNSSSFYWQSRSGAAYGLGTLPADVWTHLAITHDGTTTAAYVNGVQVKSTLDGLGD